MTAEIAICLTILGIAVILFAWDRVPADVVALAVMLAIILTGLLSPEDAFRGFGSDTVIMILGLLIMTAGLMQTGVVDEIGRLIFGYAGRHPAVFLPVIMVAVATLSAFVSNTAATALFVPLVLGYAAKTSTSPSRYLLPLAFSSIVTSSVTLISTSSNLVISEILVKSNQPAMGMFELAPAGLPIAVVGLLYIWLFGSRMLRTDNQANSSEAVGDRKYQADIVVLASAPMIGKPIDETRIGSKYGLAVIKMIRDGQVHSSASWISQAKLEAGDELFIEGQRAELLHVKAIEGVEFKADFQLSAPEAEPVELSIVEGVVLPGSPLIGRSLSELNFKDRYGLQVLGIHRAGRLPTKMSRTRLRLGDVLLLQGTNENVNALERGNLFSIFGGVDHSRLNLTHAPLAAAIFMSVIMVASFKLLSLPVAMLLGAVLMLATRCLSPDDAYRQMEWKILLLISSLLALGAAMEATGTGRYLATELLGLVGSNSPTALLAIFFLLTVALTQPMSNQAAAVVLLPVAMETAVQIGSNPRTFAMMIAIAASCSYMTPLEPSCLLVYGPGRYKFMDFFRVGLPLTLIIFVMAIVLVPLVWPLEAVTRVP